MLNEADTRAKLIDPKLHEAGWQEEFIKRDIFIIDGRIHVVGQQIRREEKKKPDYILYHGALPLAVVEAKSEADSPVDGLQQAKEYAQMLTVSFAYSSNGHGIEEFDFTTNLQRNLEKFPSPEMLWDRYVNFKGQTQKVEPTRDPLLYPYHYEPGGIRPRYYQENAICRVIEAILAVAQVGSTWAPRLGQSGLPGGLERINPVAAGAVAGVRVKVYKA